MMIYGDIRGFVVFGSLCSLATAIAVPLIRFNVYFVLLLNSMIQHNFYLLCISPVPLQASIWA